MPVPVDCFLLIPRADSVRLWFSPMVSRFCIFLLSIALIAGAGCSKPPATAQAGGRGPGGQKQVVEVTPVTRRDLIDAREALDYGLIDRVIASHELTRLRTGFGPRDGEDVSSER